jgi:predicted unusual protein kinase regulating ubiquinone biosynthesis (AarF/ABC1/UbiB family)
MQAIGRELLAALDDVLIYPTGDDITPSSSSTVPNLRNVLSRLVPAFQFKELPPYFLNNTRALATLEGMAREIDPGFNVLRFLYPYALNRIVANPSGSPVVNETLDQHLITNRDTGRVERAKIRRLVRDMSLLTGFSKRQLLLDVVHSPNGLALIRRIVKEQVSSILSPRKRQSKELHGDCRTKRRRNRRLSPFSDLFRL